MKLSLTIICLALVATGCGKDHNSIGLARFRQAVQRVWWEWLGRRRGGNRPTWAKFLQFEQRWPLPPPITLHSVCRVRSKGVT